MRGFNCEVDCRPTSVGRADIEQGAIDILSRFHRARTCENVPYGFRAGETFHSGAKEIRHPALIVVSGVLMGPSGHGDKIAAKDVFGDDRDLAVRAMSPDDEAIIAVGRQMEPPKTGREVADMLNAELRAEGTPFRATLLQFTATQGGSHPVSYLVTDVSTFEFGAFMLTVDEIREIADEMRAHNVVLPARLAGLIAGQE
eukprot:tig00021337_g20363.t1